MNRHTVWLHIEAFCNAMACIDVEVE